MLRRRAWTDDGGSAALEFIVFGLLLLTPIVYLIVALGSIQAHALGAEAGARHLARAIATAEDVEDAGERASRVLDAIAEEYGFARDAMEVSVTCDAAGDCPQAGAMVRVTIRTDVPLPLVPAVLGAEGIARVPVEATAIQKVSRGWGSP